MASPSRKEDLVIREKPSISAPSRWLSVKKKGPASRSKSRERKLVDDEKSADSGESLKQEKHEKDRSNPLSGEAIRNLFNKSDKGKEKVFEETDPNIAPHKVTQVRELLGELSIDADVNEIKRALTSPYSDAEPTHAARLINVWRNSHAGKVMPYDEKVHMLGAVNLNSISCYLDALFFSIFTRMGVFECMLSFDFPKDKTGNKKKLARLLCLWVNLLRTGFLIREDVTRDIQQTLAACGWTEAMELQQQDSTEAFNFITDVLEFPLQPLRMNIAHGGKVDEGDDKIAFERLLNVSMPESPSEGGIKLEECLTSYFNATPIKVERMAYESEKKRGTGSSFPKIPLVKTTSVEMVPEETGTPPEITASPLSIHAPELSKGDEASQAGATSEEGDNTATKVGSDHDEHEMETPEVNGQRDQSGSALKMTDSKMNGDWSDGYNSQSELWGKQDSTGLEEKGKQPTAGQSESSDQQLNGVHYDPGSLVTSEAEDRTSRRRSSAKSISDGSSATRPSRDRASSIIQNVYVDEHGNQIMGDETAMEKLKRQGSTMAKAITIPAWQFFRLVPWHNVKGQPSTDFEVAAEFKKRPVVGVCLKRYSVDPQTGRAERLATEVDIPEEMKLPYTLISEEKTGSAADGSALPREYKFVLQSVICHRGSHLNAGHYISFARVEPKKLRENRRHDFDPPPDYEQSQWVRHDDLDEDGRVQFVSDFQEAIKDEFPYLLFYQVMPLQDDEPPPSESSEEPPSYDEQFRLSVDEPSTPVPLEKTNGADHVEHATPDAKHLQSPSRPTSKPSSIRSRPSTEIDHSRKGSDDSRRHSRNPFSSRPASMNLDSAMQSPVRTPDARDSPMMNAADESTASRLSRAAAAFRGKQSRNPSQAAETRSAGADMINRMTGMLRAASREPLADPPSFNLSNANSRANTNARTSVDSAYRPSLEIHQEEAKPEKAEKGGGFLSRSGSQKKKDKQNGKKEKGDKAKHKENKGDKTPKGDPDQPDRECSVM